MSAPDPCAREHELLDALGRGFVGDELTQHIHECAPCTELHLVAGALLDDRVTAIEEAAVPAAGTIWWRMRMRQRQDIQKTARRALMAGQALTLCIAIALTARFFGAEIATGISSVVSSIRLSTPVAIGLAAWLFLAPIGGWVALRQK